jgi:Cof subfamily protein (haloacid dehalogenase superfamily)
MGYKLIALDIDGTIHSNEHPLSERTCRALSEAREAGAIVTIATGRMYLSAMAVTADLKLQSPVATYQGAHIADPISNEILWHQPLDARMLHDVLDALDSWDREILAHHRNDVYVDRMTDWVEAYVDRNHVEVHVIDKLSDLADEGVTRLIVAGEDDDVGQVTSTLTKKFDSQLQITRSLPYFCEVLHPDTGKQPALQRLCEMLDVRQEDSIAFANGDEDIPMIEWAGLGVAVADGTEAATLAADEVAPAQSEDGVAQVVERLLRDRLLG